MKTHPKKTTGSRASWPKSIPDQLKAIRDLLTSSPKTWTVEEVAAGFRSAPRKSVGQHLETLESLGILVSHDDDDDDDKRQWNGVSPPS